MKITFLLITILYSTICFADPASVVTKVRREIVASPTYSHNEVLNSTEFKNANLETAKSQDALLNLAYNLTDPSVANAIAQSNARGAQVNQTSYNIQRAYLENAKYNNNSMAIDTYLKCIADKQAKGVLSGELQIQQCTSKTPVVTTQVKDNDRANQRGLQMRDSEFMRNIFKQY